MTVLSQLALLVAMAGPAAGGLEVDARVVSRADAGGILVGAPFSLVIEARHPPGTIALLPEQLGLPGALAERRAARQHRRTVGESEAVDTYELELLAFEAGELEIPKIPLAMGSTTAETPALVVVAASALDPDEQLVASSTNPAALEELERMAAQSAPPAPVMVPDYTLIWALAVGLGLIALVVGLLRLSNKKKAAAPAPPPPPPRPADEVALEALSELRAKDPIAGGDLKGHYTALSSILRAYLGGRYGFESLELTYDELLDSLRRRETAGLDMDALEVLLFTADQVKFAKMIPLADEGYRALEDAEGIVKATAPKPPEASP